MKADLHVHTNYSYDGFCSPKEMVRAAIKKGIDCLCITDHNQIKGAVEAMKFAFDKNILIVPGIEILTTYGEMLGINVKKIIPDGLSPKEAIKQIRKQGGIAVIPHPFDKFFKGFWAGEKEIRDLLPDAIEVFNAGVILPSANKKAFLFADKNNFAFTAGSDSHKTEFVGLTYLEIPGKILTEKDLVSAVMEKRGEVEGRAMSFQEKFKYIKNLAKADIVKEFVRYYRAREKTRDCH